MFTLSKFDSHDFDLYYQLVSDAKVMAMITERALSLSEAQHDYAQLLDNNSLHAELGQFKILDTQTQAFIGLAKLAIEHAHTDAAELGYMVLPAYWGQGVASQVANQLIVKAQQLPELKRLFAIIDPANIPSRKILTNRQFESKEFRDFDGLPGEVLERIL